MSDKTLVETIDALYEKATQGPWYHVQPFQTVPAERTVHGPVPAQRVDFVSTVPGPVHRCVVIPMEGSERAVRSTDMAFITALVNAWPEIRAALTKPQTPGLEKFLGLSRDELMQDDIAFLREGTTLADLRDHHPAGIVRALCAMVIAKPATLTAPASTPTQATYDTERAALVAEVGDCCMGADPLCIGGCLVHKYRETKRLNSPTGYPSAGCGDRGIHRCGRCEASDVFSTLRRQPARRSIRHGKRGLGKAGRGRSRRANAPRPQVLRAIPYR